MSPEPVVNDEDQSLPQRIEHLKSRKTMNPYSKTAGKATFAAS